MASEVFINVPAVQKLASAFQDASEVLNGIDKALLAAIAILKASAFISFGATEAEAMYLENIEKHVQKLSKMCGELHSDINGAVGKYRDGDTSGSQRFAF